MIGEDEKLTDQEILDLPTVHAGAIALGRLMNLEDDDARAALGRLSMSEILHVRAYATQLAALTGVYLNQRCERCHGAIVWDANCPTHQAPRWRHVDQAASYRVGAHRAKPAGWEEPS